VLAIVALLLACCSAAAAFASVFARIQPALAASSPIGNGPALARDALFEMAREMVKSGAGAQQTGGEAFPKRVPPEAVELARQALLKEPLSDTAAGVLALEANAAERLAAARPLFRDIYRINRRNELVTLWLARDAANRGDIAATLTHFDEVLRTSKEARTVMLSRFALATADPSFRQQVARLLRTKPPWSQEFWSVAPDVQGAARSVGELRLLLADSDIDFQPADDQKLADKLLNGGDFALVEQLYRAETKGHADPGGEFVRNASFDRPTVLPLVDWQTYSIGDYGSEIAAKDGLMLFSATTAPGGAVAREWVSLPPGNYVLSAKMKTIARGKDDRVLARLSCLRAPTGSRTTDIPLREGETRAPFTVGAGCSEFWLDVVAAPDERSSGFDGELDLLSIRRAG
jgi:hypothetical protein